MSLTVVVLCAAWCTTCREFQPIVDRVAAARIDTRFVWCDVEDDSDVCGDIDVENFPTLVIFRGDDLLHFGVSLPHERTFARLVDEMAEATRAALTDAPDEVRQLVHAVRTRPITGGRST
jgi:thioredoxin reductase (NADPH)